MISIYCITKISQLKKEYILKPKSTLLADGNIQNGYFKGNKTSKIQLDEWSHLLVKFEQLKMI